MEQTDTQHKQHIEAIGEQKTTTLQCTDRCVAVEGMLASLHGEMQNQVIQVASLKTEVDAKLAAADAKMEASIAALNPARPAPTTKTLAMIDAKGFDASNH